MLISYLYDFCCCTNSPSFANSPHHNVGGPLTVSKPHRPTTVSSAFIQAGNNNWINAEKMTYSM